MCPLQTEVDPQNYGSHKRLLKNKAIWGTFLSAEVGVGKENLCFFIAGPSCPCAVWNRGFWQAWSKGRNHGYLKCWSPCPQTLLTKGLIFGLVPFSSFISTEEWFELWPFPSTLMAKIKLQSPGEEGAQALSKSHHDEHRLPGRGGETP